MTSTTFEDFRNVLSTAAGNASRCTRSALGATIADIAPQATIFAPDDLTDIWPGLPYTLQTHGLTVRTNSSPETTRDQPWGLTTARAAIAETGSVILVERELDRRSVSLMTNKLIVICPIAELHASLDDAARILREIGREAGSYATLVSGPSRTADIERQLTIGVQGPGELHVIFVDTAD